MNAPVESVPVSQADRDAAADAATIVEYRDLCRQGRVDGGILVQAFARHRTNQVAELVEALEQSAIELWEDSDGVAKIDPWVRCDWDEVSERCREIWRGKALKNALTHHALASHKGERS